jgi:hypothetical protein
VSTIALAFGGGLGNFLGSALYGASTDVNLPTLPRLIIGSIGLCSAIGLWGLNRRQTSHAA